MATKPTSTLVGVGSQRDKRYPDTFLDQHKTARFPTGRPWWGEREMAANRGDKDGFCSSLYPGDHNDAFGSTWTAPWFPETRFFEFNYTRNTMMIRYDKLIGERTGKFKEYYVAANKLCAQNGWPECLYGSFPRQTIIDILGEPPENPKITQAAQAGDPWILGVEGAEINTEVARLLGLTGFGLPRPQEPAVGVMTPAEVLATPAPDIARMVADAVAAALAARDTQRKEPPVRSAPPAVSDYMAFSAAKRAEGLTTKEIGAAWQDAKKRILVETGV